MRSGLTPFATQNNPSVPNVKSILMSEWHLIQNRPLLREIYRGPSFISYSKGKSLKDILVKPANSLLLSMQREHEAVRLYELTSDMEFYEDDASLAKTVNNIINWKGL